MIWCARSRAGHWCGLGVRGWPVGRVDGAAPCLVAFGQPLLECLLGAPFDHVEEPGWAGSVADAGQVDDDGDVLVAFAGVAPVGSAWGAVSGLLTVRFPRPPAEPDVRLSPHPALHERGLVQLVVTAGRSQGVDVVAAVAVLWSPTLRGAGEPFPVVSEAPGSAGSTWAGVLPSESAVLA